MITGNDVMVSAQTKRKYMRYKDGSEYYGVCQKTFEKLAKKANATYKVGKLVLVNLEILDKYLETCRVIEDY